MGKYLDSTGLSHFMGLLKSKLLPSGGSAGQVLAKTSATDHEVGWVTHSYAAASAAGGNAAKANAILYGTVDSTSTATVFTATVEGLTELVDGTCVMLHNGVVTSASGFTVNVNGLGAKPCYSNMTNATRDTTIFNIAYTMLFVYSSALDEGDGGWWIYRGYDANTNTIGYQVRTNSGTLPTTAKFYRYRILFTSADGTHWVPSNTSTSTNATAKRDVIQTPINPFGPIVYYGTTNVVEANANVAAAQLWQQYTLTFGYAFNRTGAALVLSYPAPIYIKCAPQANGSAIIDADTPYVQALPSSKDGKIYIFLGIAYSATAVELRTEHPIYWHDGTGLRIWAGAEPSAGSTVVVTQSLSSGTQVGSISVDGTSTALYAPTPPTASTTAPNMDGTAAVGTSANYAREDHVHPHDTSRLSGVILNTSSEPYDVPVANSSATIDIGDGLSVSDSNNKITLKAKTGTTSGTVATGDHTHSGYQATLVSGTNIKTINSTSILGSGNLSVQPTLVSGTNIKTVGGESLLGYGDLSVSTLVTMEDTDVDAAVELAFPIVSYEITYNDTYITMGHLRAVSLDDSASSGTFIETAEENDIVYVITTSNDWQPDVSSGTAPIQWTDVGPCSAGYGFYFIMPPGAVYINLVYND